MGGSYNCKNMFGFWKENKNIKHAKIQLIDWNVCEWFDQK